MQRDELYHYGVKGMKWGVRKDRNSSGDSLLKRYSKATSPFVYSAVNAVSSSKRYKSAKASIKKKRDRAINKRRNLTGSRKSVALKKYRNQNIDRMSDQDLQRAINRMNLERNYRSLTKLDVRKGQRAADQVLSTADTYKKTYKKVKKVAAVAAKA